MRTPGQGREVRAEEKQTAKCWAHIAETSTIHDCSPIPVFCFLHSKIFPVPKMRLNVCFNEMALFGLFAALIKGCSSYGRNGGRSTRGDG